MSLRAAALAVIAAAAQAQQQQQQQMSQAEIQAAQARQFQLLAHLPAPHHDVVTTAIMMKHEDNHVPIGEVITVAAAFINNGDAPINISGILGSLNDPLHFATYYENFTGYPIGEVVEPGGELSIDYRLLPRLPEPMPGQLSLSVFYEDDHAFYSSTFFNETVTFTKGKVDVGAALRSWAPYALGGGLSLAAIVLVVVPMLFGKSLSALLVGGSAGGARTGGDRDDRELSLRAAGGKAQKKRD